MNIRMLSKRIKEPGVYDAMYGLSSLATAAMVATTAESKKAVLHQLYQTKAGKNALEAIERGLGLALVPVDRVA